jgi:hypothetical protein
VHTISHSVRAKILHGQTSLVDRLELCYPDQGLIAN